MTEINRSGLGTAYTEVIKKGSNKVDESKIVDNKNNIDNVIDLTDPSNLTSELNQSNAEFIKVSENTYLKLDLSNPSAVKELLSDLKSNILSEDGQKVLEGFNYVSFSEETGISIQSVAQAKRLTVTPKVETTVQSQDLPISEQQKIFEEINNIKDTIATTSPKEIEKLKELQNQLKSKLLTLVSPEMKEDVKKLLDLPKDVKLNKQQSQDLNNIISKYKESNKLKDLMLSFDLISPENTLRDLAEKISEPKVKDSVLKTLIETRNEIIPNGVTAVALPVKKESFDAKDAVAELDKLAEQHPEVKELLDKLEASKGTGKSLKLMGITKEDLALYLTTGQVSPKIQESIKKAYSTGNWPAVNSVIEITRLNRLALQDQLKISQSKINDLYKSLSATSNPEEQKKIKENIFKLTSEIDELEVRLEEDNNTLRTLPDTATRARTAVSQRAIGIFDAKLAKLSPDSPEYAKIKQQRDQEMVSLRNDASSLDARIEKTEAKGKKPSSDLKGLAVNVHTTTATSDISMFGLESSQKANKPPSSDPLSPPPKSEHLVDAEKHVKKVEKYTPNASGSLAVQDLKLSLHQAQRQDSKDRLRATGAVYDEKSRTFKYPIPTNYQPTNQSAIPSDKTYSSPEDLTSTTDKTTAVVISDAQKDVEKDYHVAGIQTLKTIESEKKILKSELPDRFSPAPTDPQEAKRQTEIVNRLASLEASATDIKIEQNNVLIAEQKANKELTSSDKALTAKEEKYLQISKQKESVSTQIRAVTEHLGELQAEIDDWKDNYVFDNPEKQQELEKVKSQGQSALTLLQKEQDRLRDEERTLIPEYTTDEKPSGSIAGANESFRLSSAKQQVTSVQSQALQEAYDSVRDSGVRQVNAEVFLERAKSGIQEGERVFDTAPEWMKGNPEFKASKAHHQYTASIKQRSELAESVQFIAEEKELKAQPSLPKTATKEEISIADQKGNKASSEAGLSAKQAWDTETVAKLEETERVRVSLKDSKDITKETKEGLAIESIGVQVTVAKGVSNTIPNESLRLLGRSYEMAEFEVSPDTPNADGTHPIQTDLLTNIGQTALDCVGSSFKRELIFKGQKALEESDLSASQNLLNLSSMVADTLVQKTGGLQASNRIKEGKEKWDTALKDVGKQVEEHKDKLKAEKALVLDAFDYQLYRTKDAASGHFLAAEMWQFRDQLEADDPEAWQALAIMTINVPGVSQLAAMKATAVTAGFRSPDTSDPNFNYDKIDLEALNKLRSGLESRYDSQLEQLDVMQKGLDSSISGNRGLTYLSALKLYSESLEDNTTDVKLPQSLAKGVLGKSNISVESLVNPKSNQWDPALRSWAGKGALSDQGAGFIEESRALEAQSGSLVAGGYQRELSEAKQMEARYVGMSVTDVLGIDTTGWEIKDENFTWLNKVGSVLNKTDTVALIAEIAITEAVTAGLGSALATARVARFLEQVAVNYPKVEKAIALARAVSSFAPSVISGEKGAAAALSLIGKVAKGEGSAVRIMSGLRRLEEAGQVGLKASRVKTIINGSVHMGQVMAVQGGLGLVAERMAKDHPLAAKMLEFSGQFLFTSSASKFSGIKDFSGRLAMNLATMYGQQYTGQLVSYGLEKALESSSGQPLTPDQKLEVKKWSQRVAMVTGIIVPNLVGAMHGQQLSPEKIQELSTFHTETLNTGLKNNTPEYKKLQDGFSDYLKASNDTNSTPDKSKATLKSLQEIADTLPPQAKENLTSFIKEESAKLALKEMPKFETDDPNAYAQHVEKYLNELNGRDGLVKYDSDTIKNIVEQQRVSKTVEGIQKLDINIEALGKGDNKESEYLIKTISRRKEELVNKLSEVKSLSPESVKEIVDTSLKMSLEQLVSQSGVNKDSLFAIAQASKEIDTPLVIKLRPEEGLPAQEFSVKFSKDAQGKEFLELSREGYDPIKLSKDDITKAISNGDHIDLTLRDGLKLQKVVEEPETTEDTGTPPVVTKKEDTSKPIEFKPIDSEVSNLFNNKPLKSKEDVIKFVESKKSEIEKFLTDNNASGNTNKIVDFYKMIGGWDNIRSLEGKIDSNLFNKIHESRDIVVKSLWEQVNKEAEAKGIKLADGFVGTPPTDPSYKRAWSDVDFSVKIKAPKDGATEAEIKKFNELSDVDKHIIELELMQSMQRKLQETFDGSPSHTVDSNAYATPLIMDVGKGKPISDSLKALDSNNQKEMDFYQIRLGFGTSKSGTASYNRFKKEAIRAAKVKAENLAKKGMVAEANKLLTDVETGFSQAESRLKSLKGDLKEETKLLKAKYPDKSEKAIEEMALTELRFKKENDLIQFMKDNKELLGSDSVEGQAKRVEFNQKAREMRAFWPEAYIGDQAAKWGSSGGSSNMDSARSSMSNAQKMQVRVSQDQFKLHWLVEVRNEKDLSSRLLKASKYELRDLVFKKDQMESVTGSSHTVTGIEKNPSFNKDDQTSRDTVKAYTSEDFPDHAAFQEIKEFAKSPADAEKIWIKHFGKEPNPKETASKALEDYLSLMESVTTVNLFNHILQPEIK